MDRESKGCTNGTEQLMNWLASGLQLMTNVLKICLSFEPINIIAPVSLFGDVYRVHRIEESPHHWQNHLVSPT
jgi:hypothetical protein